MRTLNYQAVFDRVYRHFVIERKPPGFVGGRPAYHSGQPGDPVVVDCPCAIGLFDTGHRLDGVDLPVDEIHDDAVLRDVFEVDSLAREDVLFLREIQVSHDCLASQRLDAEQFTRDLTRQLGHIADMYHCRPPGGRYTPR